MRPEPQAEDITAPLAQRHRRLACPSAPKWSIFPLLTLAARPTIGLESRFRLIAATSRRLASFGQRPAFSKPRIGVDMTWPVKVWFYGVIVFLKSPEGGVNCVWFRTAGFPGSGGVHYGKRFLRFFHTFSRQNTHVQMKAPPASSMKPADDRQEVLLREAVQEGQRGNARTHLTGKHD